MYVCLAGSPLDPTHGPLSFLFMCLMKYKAILGGGCVLWVYAWNLVVTVGERLCNKTTKVCSTN